MLPFALSTTTLIRVIIPLVAGASAGLGAGVGAFRAVLIAIPERTKIVVGYQSNVIDDLVADNKRLTETVARLEERVRELEDEPRAHLA
jgi:hypothetical protein